MTTGTFELDYADMQATADGFHTAADDLQACLLGPIPAGADVYGYPVLDDAVARVAEALRERHTAAAESAERVGVLLEACLWGYRKADEAAAALLEARLRLIEALSEGARIVSGMARPV